MKKQFAVLTFLAAVVIGVAMFKAQSLGAPSFNLADYPHMLLSHVHATNLKASACANNAQDALKRSGFSRIGSSKPGNAFYGTQGAYIAGICWDSDRHIYYYFVAGPDKGTAEDYAKTLRENTRALFEN